MDNRHPRESGQVVSPYLLQPTRDLLRVQLESVLREAMARGTAHDLDQLAVARSAREAAYTAFPDLDAGALSDAMRDLGITAIATS